MSTLNLLYSKEIKINDSIKVLIPTVGDIIDNEDNYYSLVTMLTAMPIDMMVQLDDIGIDFTTIDDYDLFLTFFQGLKTQDCSLVFGDLDLSKFDMGINEENGTIVLVNPFDDVVIDRAIHGQIACALRKIHHFEKNNRTPGNDEAKRYMISRAREKQRRRRNRTEDSQLESLIVAMVNAEQYKYDFERTRELSIYQFNESVKQIIKKVDYDNRMYGVYAGTVNAKELSEYDLNWLVHKK